MSDVKHTPGPWKMRPSVYSPNFIIESPVNPIAVTLVRGKKAQMEANAQLIAAAPDLLTALERTLGELPMLSSYLWENSAYAEVEELEKIEEQSRAAIAKARGEYP